MIYELRIYETLPGRMQALEKRFAEVTLEIFKRHGIEAVGFWKTEIGESNQELIYLLRFENHAAREKAWAAFQADPEWQRKRAESEADGLIVKNIRNAIWRPTPYSPMQ